MIYQIKRPFIAIMALVSILHSGQNVTQLPDAFNQPYIDKKVWREKPVRHLYVHGGFIGTDTRFSFYFPEKNKYEGRFYQYITPAPDNENLSQNQKGEEDKIGFALGSGAYFVETNGGGKTNTSENPLITAYLANAASAQYSKNVAAGIYGKHRTYGYSFGGSGGAYRTIGGIEDTEGIWDGVVPFVVGSPMAIPNMFTVRMHAMRILNKKFFQIIDATEPGGSGNIYANLNEEEKSALLEVTKMGFPVKSWFGYETMGVHGFSAVYSGMKSVDPSYFEDFWTKRGYLGFDKPESFEKYRLIKTSRIKKLIYEDDAINLGLVKKPKDNELGSADLAWKGQGKTGKLPVAFQLEDELPQIDFLGGDLKINSGDFKNSIIQISKIQADYVVIGIGDYPYAEKLKTGEEVILDNSDFLAAQTYHRHQVPDSEYKVWNQFRNINGKPIYPQRPILIAPLFTQAAAGVLPTGNIKGKVIVVASLWDREAFPWNADWYANQVKKI